MNTLVKSLTERKRSCLPIWFMRQAGRYLPEFRKIRSKNKNFIKLCLNSRLSSKITLQPIKRFNIDAAIIFSDILIVPYALGQEVNFKKNEGPKLSKFNLKKFLNNNNDKFTKNLKPVYEAIKKTRKSLNNKKSLISFVGAPWTLFIYMMGLKDSKNKIDFKLVKQNKEIDLIFNKLNTYLCLHIKNQINAGADVVQIFDSWAGLIPNKYLEKFCFKPNYKLVSFCKKNNIPVICFPKGIKKKYLNFLNKVKPNGLSLDYDIDPVWANKNLKNVCLQGGIDPKILFKEEKLINQEIDKYLGIFKKRPYIFNLGHGLLPKTNPEVLKKMIRRVKLYK
ncbi:uroporphyrinogen decarboxylase [Pelagibacteraceae bacterium]|nr:uroporphyrinogen decarboxylase [Pelagibacteraceae bacterium]